MAFAPTSSSSAASVTPLTRGGGNQHERNRADGFLNFYLPTSNGRRKVGYIPLHGGRAFDAAIIERLKSGGEDAIKALSEVLQVEFNTGEASEDNMPLF